MKCEWKNYQIGDLCNSISETYKGKDEYVVLINTSDVLNGRILNHTLTKNSSLKGQFKKRFQIKDILYSEIRPANRRFAFVDIENTHNYIASTTDIILPEYLFMFLQMPDVISELQVLAETRSGTFPQITFSSEISPLNISLPNKETQNKIVLIFCSFNDKIELNNKINENLERQARTLYKAMFIDNPNLKITQGILNDIAVITMGQSPSGSSYNEDGNGEVFYQGRAEFGFRFPTRRLFTTEPKRIADAGDVLLSVRAPVGDLNVAYEQCCVGRGLGAIHSKDGNSSFLLYTMFSLKPQLDVFNGEGTVFGSINKDRLSSLPVDIPCADEIDKFEAIVRPIDDLIRTNYEENYRLEMLRDSLLPRLMSGEIDIEDVNI